VATAIAVVAALAAACCFAFAAVIQHGAARDTGEGRLGPGLLLALARNPRWLAGAALGGLSFAIQGLALAFGPLALVQPLAAADVLFALPMIAVLHHYRLTRGDWLGAAAVGGGIAVFLAVSPPTGGVSAPGSAAWAPVILAVAAIAACSVLAAARVRGPARVMWLAAGAGVTFGVLDALTKSTVDLLADRGLAALLRWEPYGLLAAGLLGAFLSQSAFRAGALSVSLPVIDTLEPVSAVVIAATVFSERLAASPGQLAAQLAGGAVAAAGIAALSRSSVAAAETRPAPEPLGHKAGWS
jgi:drug/metabolite transporter (DMT)-like permease